MAGGGSDTVDQPGVYGALGTPAAGNLPGAGLSALSWTDSSGRLGLFGGVGENDAGAGDLNDLWEYTPQASAATPSFSPAGGTYTTAQTVTISDTTSGATIFYTTDGSTPTTSSNEYTGPIDVTSTETSNAIAVASESTSSAVATATNTVNLPAAAMPTFSPREAPTLHHSQ